MAMADKKGEINSSISEMKAGERKIPVFTVLKNNSILKNIFLLDKPPLIPSSSLDFSSKNGKESITEETLMIGRHPDCNITLEHPSISRFHLRIHSNPSSHSLSVIDLYSVHGTWISGKKIEPGVLVELKEGDIMKLGGSHRLYKLHWLPITRAYDLDNPYMPPLDTSDDVEETGGMHPDEKGLHAKNEDSDQIQRAVHNLDCLKLLLADEKQILSAQKISPSALPMPEDVNAFFEKTKVENTNLFKINYKERENSTPDAPFALGLSQTASRIENPEISGVQLEKTSDSSIWLRRGKLASVHIQISRNREMKSARSNSNSKVKSPARGYLQTESVSHGLLVSGDEERIFTTDRENCSSDFPLHQSLDNVGRESSSSEFISKTTFSCVDHNEEEILTPDNSEVKSPIYEYSHTGSASEDPFASSNIDEKQSFTPDKESSSPKPPLLQSLGNIIGQEKSRGKFISMTLSSCVAQNEKNFAADNAKVKSHINEYSRTETISEDAFSTGDSDEKQIFTQDKENFCSNSLTLEFLDNTNQGNSRTLFSRADQDKEEVFTPDNTRTKSTVQGYYQTDSDRKQVLSPDKENCCLNALLFQSLENSVQENSRSELTSMLFSFVDENKEEIFSPNEDNITPNILQLRSMKNSEIPFSCVDKDDEEIFTPDKENITPKTLQLRSMKKLGRLKQVKHPKSYRSSPLKKAVDCNTYQEEVMHASLDEENQTLTVLQNQKSVNSVCKRHAGFEQKLSVLIATADRKPLRSLLVNSTSNSKIKSKASDLDTTATSGNSFNSMRLEETEEIFYSLDSKTIKEEDKRWTIVVDVACLLSKRSRKELQLMRGLKGTSLIVPRIVIRELDCMLRRGNFFRQTTEVSAALQWIEESMQNVEGWIHVQSLAEERRLVAPTPPSSPLSWFCEERGAFSIGSSPFSPCNIQDIVTPTTEDHILECALYFKRIRNGGQLVLLSDDVALKIKAMSEGVICETAKEFRNSLVNPFSERFLYTDSSPRGPTWTCVDDVVLKEKYYPDPLKKLSKSGEAVKGLKLVLLHNSNFRMTSLVS